MHRIDNQYRNQFLLSPLSFFGHNSVVLKSVDTRMSLHTSLMIFTFTADITPDLGTTCGGKIHFYLVLPV